MKICTPIFYFALFCLTTFSLPTFSQNTVTIPDPNLAYFFQQIYPSCITGNQLDTTCSLLHSAGFVSVANRNISNLEGIQYLDSLVRLTISDNPVTSIPRLANTIEEFYAEDVPLNSLPPLPDSLFRMELDKTNLTSLPPLPPGLTILRCEISNLTSLPALPAGMFSIQVKHNQITSLPTLPTSLNNLDVYNNQLTALPTLPPSLGSLDIGSNQISTLPALPNTLNRLAVNSNNLSTLPASLPPNLTSFYAGGNNFSTIPPLPAGLWHFSCGSNNLTTIPTLPAGLTSFYCNNNMLTTLPALPNGIRFLFLQGNQITQLPNPLPDSLLSMNCSDNLIECFPPLPTETGHYLTLFPNPATCLPNYGAWMSATYLGYPLCVVGDPNINPNNCQNGTGIYGSVFKDNNANCTFDAAENGVLNIPIRLLDGNSLLLQQSNTTYTGSHFFNPGNGNYTLEVNTTTTPFLSPICPTGSSQSTTLSNSTPVVNGVDFDLECNGSIDLGVQAVTTQGLAFPGQPHIVRAAAGDFSQWYGFNCASGVSGQVVVTVSGPVTFSQVATGGSTPTVVGNVFTYAVSDFGTFDFNSEIALEFDTDTTATASDTICVDVVLTSSATDINPGNNTFRFCYPVRNSYDPNEKEVYPGNVPVNYTDWFTYTIHFQNTGNAPAFNIKLLDTLDANLDLSTFQVVNFSHANRVNVTGNQLRVDFPNIQLVDSTTDYYGSMGYFQYRLKPVSGVSAGTQILNTAHIFFDFNAPIVTNTTVNEFSLAAGRVSQALSTPITVFPNPSTGLFQLEAKHFEGALSGEVLNTLGQVMLKFSTTTPRTQLDLTQLDAGIYFLRVQDHSGKTGYERIIKQ